MSVTTRAKGFLCQDCALSTAHYPVLIGVHYFPIELPVMSRETSLRSVFDSLPDELLVSIISLLPFKDAVRTSILAKRWTSIWRHTKNIELNQNFFIKEGVSVYDLLLRQGPRGIAPFPDFAANFLNKYKGGDITSFNLVLADIAVFLGVIMKAYVQFAISRQVKHLTVNLTQPIWMLQRLPFRPMPIMCMPDRFYRHCDQYESLTLSGIKVNFYPYTNFAALRSVSLAWTQLGDDDITQLVAESPCLQDLRLANCWGFDIEIQSDSLKTLVVDKCTLDQVAVSVLAPNLKLFVYSGLFGDLNFNCNVPNLEEVYIDYDMEEDFEHYWTIMYNQYWQFRNVRVLQVCSFVLQILPFVVSDLYVDPKHLIINTSFHHNDFYGIDYIMQSCNSVEVLTIDIMNRPPLNHYECPMAFDHDLFWEIGNPATSVDCLEKTLKVVEVKGFSGTRHQVQFLKQIMYLGKVLENILLFKKEDAKQQAEEGYQILLESQRSSFKLQIAHM